MRVALVHDWLTGMRGGERVLEALLGLFPAADIFTLVHVPGSVAPAIEARPIRTSFIQRLPGAPRAIPPVPAACSPSRCAASTSGATISCWRRATASRSAPAPPAGAAHVVYCFTPMRYAWTFEGTYVGRVPPLARGPLRPPSPRSAGGTARLAGAPVTSGASRDTWPRRIRRVWGREARVVYPPVRTAFFRPVEPGARRGRRLPLRVRADAVQAGRPRGGRVQRGSAAASTSSGTGPELAAAPAARRPHGALPRLAARRGRARRRSPAAGRSSSPARRSSGSRRSRRRRPAGRSSPTGGAP